MRRKQVYIKHNKFSFDHLLFDRVVLLLNASTFLHL
jgi:hypothetical protein